MKILICGSRDWRDPHPIYLAIAGCKQLVPEDDKLVVVHGAARGADSLAGAMAEYLGVEVVPVPADWKTYGKSAGPIRNQKMLDEHDISVTYAFRIEGKSNGTDDMISRSQDAGIPTYVTYRK